jgi:hypothetical protein
MATTAATNANMAYYLTIWNEMLSALLGWSEEDVMHSVRRTGILQYLADPEDMFYHETPQYWATNQLIPSDLKERLSGADLQSLRNRSIDAFWDDHHYEFPPGTDWQPFREKIERILAEYGSCLDRSKHADRPNV